MSGQKHFSVCNDTKWLELRACVLSFETEEWPEFRSKCLVNGYVSAWDSEWYYHFDEGGFKDIEWFELRLKQPENEEIVCGILKIGLVGERRGDAIRIYGYVPNGNFPSKLTINDFGESEL